MTAEDDSWHSHVVMLSKVITRLCNPILQQSPVAHDLRYIPIPGKLELEKWPVWISRFSIFFRSDATFVFQDSPNL